MDIKDSLRGALVGLAVGDALGTTLEFTGQGPHGLTDMIGGGPFKLQAGEWTDDTSMALCLAASLVQCGGFIAYDQMERYVRWRKHGYMSSNGRCFDIGNTVSGALERFTRDGNPFAGLTTAVAGGNGALMRLAPVVMFYAKPIDDDVRDATLICVERAAESTRTTHGYVQAVDASKYFAWLLCLAANGYSKSEMFDEEYPHGDLDPAIAEIANGSFKFRNPPQIRGTGYVVKSLEAALWAFWNSDTFEEGALLAVNLGEDADTTGAIYGQIAGMFYGESNIPLRWRTKLARRDEIYGLANEIVAMNPAI